MRRFASIFASVLILMSVSLVSQRAVASVQVGVSSDRRMTVQSEGMAPTLHRGDAVNVNTSAKCCRRGDIVAFLLGPNPGWRSSVAPNSVKRVIALPGETVSLCATGAVCIDGKPLREKYLAKGTITTMPSSLPYITDADNQSILACESNSPAGECTVPAGMLFVLGDNRQNSQDSRVDGPIRSSSVFGLVTKAR